MILVTTMIMMRLHSNNNIRINNKDSNYTDSNYNIKDSINKVANFEQKSIVKVTLVLKWIIIIANTMRVVNIAHRQE